MKAIKALSLASAALVAALVAGCDNKPATAPMPEVNDENCKPENIAKIEDKGPAGFFVAVLASWWGFQAQPETRMVRC
ncbi:entry exclusion lipoprotein TrbK [Burkholderia plantarii]|uniref:entry exclusion lipoprotein TrbK n=1 Tax=Burkholderia plantarii TaxID=41899 RepID=UPI003FD77346